MAEVDITADLAAQQSALAAALAAKGPVPEGFDVKRVEMASKMLLRKRSHSAASSWPGFAQCYGADFERDFAAFARSNPIPPRATPWDDVLGFAKCMADENRLSDACLRLLCRAESRLLVPVRRGRFIAMRFPVLGVLTLRLPKLS